VDVKSLPQRPDENQRTYLFVAIDRATHWVYVERLQNQSTRSASGFLERLIAKAPFTITKLLTDNGQEFTDRFYATGERIPPVPTPVIGSAPNTPSNSASSSPGGSQTNGMVERFNGRIADVLRTHRFDSSASLQATLKRFVYWVVVNLRVMALPDRTACLPPGRQRSQAGGDSKPLCLADWERRPLAGLG